MFKNGDIVKVVGIHLLKGMIGIVIGSNIDLDNVSVDFDNNIISLFSYNLEKVSFKYSSLYMLSENYE